MLEFLQKHQNFEVVFRFHMLLILNSKGFAF